MGHGLATRHAIAKCVQPEKNLRECEAINMFYQHNPEPWMSLAEYMENL